MRRLPLLTRVNLLAAAVIAVFGAYAWHLTGTRRILLLSRSHSLPAPKGAVAGSGTQVWLVGTTHPHALWAYAAWITAAFVCLVTALAVGTRPPSTHRLN